MMSATHTGPSLEIVRMPGEFGPVVRCTGELVEATVKSLQREMAVLERLDHPVVILNLSGCTSLDAEGAVAILQSYKRRRARGWQLVIVVRAGHVARVLQLIRLDRVIPIFRSEEAVALTIRGGPLPAPPTSWEEALSRTLAHWREIEAALDQELPDEVVRLLTCPTALCDRSEAFFRDGSRVATSRCEFCPLFHGLGGQPGDRGCASLVNPIIAAVQAHDRTAAHCEVAGALAMLDQMRKGAV